MSVNNKLFCPAVASLHFSFIPYTDFNSMQLKLILSACLMAVLFIDVLADSPKSDVKSESEEPSQDTERNQSHSGDAEDGNDEDDDNEESGYGTDEDYKAASGRQHRRGR